MYNNYQLEGTMLCNSKSEDVNIMYTFIKGIDNIDGCLF